jgi:hypothetical protein
MRCHACLAPPQPPSAACPHSLRMPCVREPSTFVNQLHDAIEEAVAHGDEAARCVEEAVGFLSRTKPAARAARDVGQRGSLLG